MIIYEFIFVLAKKSVRNSSAINPGCFGKCRRA